jgi:hypothetical protein
MKHRIRQFPEPEESEIAVGFFFYEKERTAIRSSTESDARRRRDIRESAAIYPVAACIVRRRFEEMGGTQHVTLRGDDGAASEALLSANIPGI